MRKSVLTTLGLLAISTWTVAQNPTQTTFSVDLKTEQGTDTTIEINSIDSNSLRFIGGEAEVYNTITGETTRQGNQDLQSWVEDSDLESAKLRALPSSGLPVSGYGYCIARHPAPTEADSLLTCQLQPDGSFTALFYGLDYTTTYYARPFVRMKGYVMYGNELALSVLHTVEAALAYEPELAGGNFYDAATGLTLSTASIQSLLGTDTLLSEAVTAGVAADLGRFLTDEMLTRLKALSAKTIDCTDGQLFVTDEVPADIAEGFRNYFYGGVTFTPATLDMEAQAGDRPLTMNIVTANHDPATGEQQPYEYSPIECDPSWGVPGNEYYTFPPSSKSVNPQLAFDVPKYLLPQTYELSVVMVIPDMENDPRPYYFRASIYEQNPDGTYNTKGASLTNPADQSQKFESASVRCDTVSLGRFTFNGNPGTILQLLSNISSSRTSTYNRTMSIAQFSIVPVREEENQ